MSGMNSEEQLDQALRDLSASMRQQQTPARVEAALLQAYRRRHQKRRVWPAWTAALAAAAVVAAVLFVKTAPQEAKQPTQTLVRAEAPPPAIAVSQKPRKAAPAPRRNSEREIVTDFFPLRNGPLYPEEMSQLVRVRLPRATLIRYGIPGGQDGPESTVRADVLLGRDGMARAIRFVR